MEKVQVTCDLCGQKFPKNRAAVNEHSFCCREHFYRWNAGRMADYNRTDNPMNKPGGVLASRIHQGEKLRGGGDGKTYRKMLGRHEHRRIAEEKLGRPLRKGEVVHHIDGNKQNNAPENIEVLPSQAEHARLHNKMRKKRKGR